jgi:hypothetical protein
MGFCQMEEAATCSSPGYPDSLNFFSKSLEYVKKLEGK